MDLLTNPFFQRALVAALIIGFANGFFSGFVVLRRNALSVSALSHTMLPGITLGIVVAGSLTQVSAFLGALFAALIVGLGSVAVSRGQLFLRTEDFLYCIGENPADSEADAATTMV